MKGWWFEEISRRFDDGDGIPTFITRDLLRFDVRGIPKQHYQDWVGVVSSVLVGVLCLDLGSSGVPSLGFLSVLLSCSPIPLLPLPQPWRP